MYYFTALLAGKLYVKFVKNSGCLSPILGLTQLSVFYSEINRIPVNLPLQKNKKHTKFYQ